MSMRESIKKFLKEVIVSNQREYNWKMLGRREGLEIINDMTEEFQQLLDNDEELNSIKSTGIITGVEGYLREQKFENQSNSIIKCKVYVLVPFKFMKNERVLDIAMKVEAGYSGLKDLENLTMSRKTLGPFDLESKINEGSLFMPDFAIEYDK